MIENWIPILLPNGNLLVPTAFEQGELLGDGMDEVAPDSESYVQWIRWMEARNISPRLESQAVSQKINHPVIAG